MIKKGCLRNKSYIIRVLGTIFMALTLTFGMTGSAEASTQKSIAAEIYSHEYKVNSDNVSFVRDTPEIYPFSSSEDPFSDTQWYIENVGYYLYFSNTSKKNRYSAEGMDMEVAKAWEVMKEKAIEEREVIVAVIDSGIDYSHPDLADNIWVNKGEIPDDNIDNDKNGYIDDVYGWDYYNSDASICHYEYSEALDKMVASPEDNDNHGTHIAGIIGAVANNNIGIAGVASNINIKIMTLKINGGKSSNGSVASAIEAIQYATMMGADICNLSWGTTVDIPGLEEVMRESDMLFVVAAGNTASDIDEEPMYPASYKLDNIITVTPVDAFGDLTYYSNYGATTVDLAAPGDEIFSTVVGGYALKSGSSMAAPQVSAIAAMIYACNEDINAAEVKKIITDTIKPIPGLDGYMLHAGIPSAYEAVMAADDMQQDKEAPVLSLKMVYDKELMKVKVQAEDLGGSGIRVLRWMAGSSTKADFKRGTEGIPVEDNQISVKNPGTYTFYASDYSGNETVKTYTVKADITKPKLSASYSISNDYKIRTVSVLASDKQSGLKSIMYLPGEKAASDFQGVGSGTKIEVKNGKGSFKVKKDGPYTIYASDNRGNISIKTIKIKTIKVTEFKLASNRKTLSVGQQFDLTYAAKPLNYTDKITYSSTNEKIAAVSSKGKVTAYAKGSVYVIARTSSGINSACYILVK